MMVEAGLAIVLATAAASSSGDANSPIRRIFDAIRNGDEQGYLSCVDPERFVFEGPLADPGSARVEWSVRQEADAIRRVFRDGKFTRATVRVDRERSGFALAHVDLMYRAEQTKSGDVFDLNVAVSAMWEIAFERDQNGASRIVRIVERSSSRSGKPRPLFGLIKYLHSERFRTRSADAERASGKRAIVEVRERLMDVETEQPMLELVTRDVYEKGDVGAERTRRLLLPSGKEIGGIR